LRGGGVGGVKIYLEKMYMRMFVMNMF